MFWKKINNYKLLLYNEKDQIIFFYVILFGVNKDRIKRNNFNN